LTIFGGLTKVTTLLTVKQIRDLLQYRSRSAFYGLLARDPDLQACAVRIGRRFLFDAKRIERYIDRHRIVKTHADSTPPIV